MFAEKFDNAMDVNTLECSDEPSPKAADIARAALAKAKAKEASARRAKAEMSHAMDAYLVAGGCEEYENAALDLRGAQTRLKQAEDAHAGLFSIEAAKRDVARAQRELDCIVYTKQLDERRIFIAARELSKAGKVLAARREEADSAWAAYHGLCDEAASACVLG